MASDKNAVGAKRSAGDSMNDLRLGAARKRLAESRDEEDAIEGLREIVANLLGSEEIGLFTFDRTTQAFQVCWSFGIDLENYDLSHALGEDGLRCVLRGECHLDLSGSDRSTARARAKAFVPIRAAHQTIAVLAILRLLPQKLAFDSFDLDLFNLLSNQAARPLFGHNSETKPETGRRGVGA